MKKALVPVYLSTLFFSLHFSLTAYVNSSYLAKFFSPFDTSLLFVVGYGLGIVLLFLIPGLLRRYDLRRLFMIFLVMSYVAVSGLIIAPSELTVALAFILYAGVQSAIYYLLDIFLENLSVNEKTGVIRGGCLTVMNFAVALGPLLVSFLTRADDFSLVYIASLFALLPIFIIAMASFRWQRRSNGESVTPHHHIGMSLPLRKWWRKTDVRRATIARFTLEFFFSFMMIFVPVYLSTNMGFSWSQIGVMFSIVLIPFVLFEWPVGILADRWCGEKEFMTIGFFMTGTALLFMPFIGKTIFVWTTVLFLSRVGASFIEITTETYFFKKVDVTDTGLISVFRLVRPSAIIAGALVGGITVALLPYQAIFFVLALAIFIGMRESVYIRDTL